MADTASDVSEVSAASTNTSGNQPRSTVVRRQHSRRHSSITEKYDMVKSAAHHWRKGSGGGSGAGSLDFSTAFLPGLSGDGSMEQPTADEEIQVISSMKEKLDKFWNEHIDVDDNGDCDIDEWVTRLQDLNVDLSEDEMRMFFNRVDDGQAQFLDRNEFIQFMNHQFSNDELIKYQNAIFDKIDGAKLRGPQGGQRDSSNFLGVGNLPNQASNNSIQSNNSDENNNNNDDGDGQPPGHERTHSNLVTENDANEMDEVAIHLMKQNLKRELKRQQTGHYKKLSAAENILAQIKNQEDEHPETFDESKVREWGPVEVTAWVLDNFDVNVEQVPLLIRKQGVTGTNLLYDVDEAILRSLGFTSNQARDCMRYIEELRDAHRTLLQESTQEQIQSMSVIFEPGPEISPEATPEPMEAASRLDGLDPLTVSTKEIKKTLEKHNPQYLRMAPNTAVKEFLQTLELLKSKSKNFCVKTRDAVKDWTREEVAYWAKESGFEKYCYAFYTNDVTGSMLINDLTKDSLKQDIGTTSIHASSILRTIKELQEYLLDFRNAPDYRENTIEYNVYGNDTIFFKSEYNELMDEMEQEKKDLEDRIKELEDQLTEANEKLSAMRELEEENQNNQNQEEDNDNDNQNGDEPVEAKEEENKNENVQMEIVKNYAEMTIEDLEIELQLQKSKVTEIEELIKEKTPKSEDIIAMEELMKSEWNGNLDVLPTSSHANSWKVVEVGAWMRNVVRLPEYIGHIYKMNTDGDILLHEWRTKESISELLELPETQLHVKHILREANKLRDACGIADNMDNAIVAGKNGTKSIDKMNLKELRERVEELNDNVKEKEQENMNLELKNDELINKCQKYEEGQSVFTDKIKKLEEEKLQLQQTDDALKSELAHLHDVKIDNENLQNSLKVFEKNKLDTIQDLCMELDTLRTGTRIMSKHIIVLQNALKDAGFRPMETFMTFMGYEKASTTR